MNILLLGSSGFVGKRVAALLKEQGHEITMPRHHELDLLNLSQEAAMPLLQNKDVVVNTVGIMSRHANILETIHHHAPTKMAAWAKEAGVNRWAQLSALGADAAQTVPFVGSKGRGDEAVMNSGLQTAVARPSVIYGRGGVSCEMFIRLASLPILALPGGGKFELQPVHVADVAQGLVNFVNQPPENGTIVNMTGSLRCTMADYLNILRRGLHYKPDAKIVSIPLGLIKPFLPLGKIITNGVISPDTFSLLEQGSCADNSGFTKLLGRKPLAASEFAGLA
ncbi:NAD-dependent epimerase/dehydratase family protein [Stenoxybacter acetivorans]|uniref:NAD-dependent epimerase/dehydratase family protein n=1 Tax=Stenoxybacter acetivorans TaxID=422441 RepID=UPI000569891B|nr:NAD-dependent epimerase/dehydratase family protein [Stenoxybacter acetivorans]